MQLEDADYWRDGIAMAVVDDLNKDAIYDAVCMAEAGDAFNAAIAAAIELEDIVSWHYATCQE